MKAEGNANVPTNEKAEPDDDLKPAAAISQDSVGVSERKISTKKQKKKKRPYNAKNSGDPPMSKAIKAKIDNPDMSLYEALLVGGFSFAQRQGTKDIDVRDSDGISSKQVSLSITVYNVIDRVARNGFFFRLFSHTLQTNCDISMPKKTFSGKTAFVGV